MAEYIERETAVSLIEDIQKELCPSGRYGRQYVYGSDREVYDAYGDILDLLEAIPSEDVAPVVHGHWKVNGINPVNGTVGNYHCSACSGVSLKSSDYCPNCGANMDEEEQTT